MNLKIPADLDPETFLRQIGGDCDDVADKFETIDEIFTEGRELMKKRRSGSSVTIPYPLSMRSVIKPRR